jgi:hypothetical protein
MPAKVIKTTHGCADIKHFIDPSVFGIDQRREWTATVDVMDGVRVQQSYFGGDIVLDIVQTDYEQKSTWSVGFYPMTQHGDECILGHDLVYTSDIAQAVQTLLPELVDSMSSSEYREYIRTEAKKWRKSRAKPREAWLPAFVTKTKKRMKVLLSDA